VNKGRYNFDKIAYSYYRDQNVALEAFFAGEFDLQQENVAKLWATAYTAPAIKDGRIIKAEISNTRPTGMQGFIYNTRRPVFADPEVRKALAYAFDFEWENKQFAFGAYNRTRSYFENSDLASHGLPTPAELEILEPFRDQLPPEVFTTEYNPPSTDGSGNNRANLKKAADILDAAGYKVASDSIRVHDKTGTRLKFEFMDANPAFERWILPFTQNLKKIGVEASFRVVDDAQYINRMQNFDFDMTTMVIPQSDSPGNEQREFWTSAKADLQGSRNYIGLKNPVIDKLVDGLIASDTREELVNQSRALDRVLQWDYLCIPNWYYNKWRLAWWSKLDHPKTLSGLTPAVTDTWWVKE
jgi:microcin C transport system substrate-binding protein